MAHPARTVREQFLVEIGSGRELEDMAQLNTLFTVWVETVYHRREHSETGQAPIDRWSVITPPMPSTAHLREAFLWSEWRTVTKTGTVGLHGNTYEVDAVLIGRKVELVFDPFDLTRIDVRWRDRSMGHAVPHVIGRHVHAKARPDDTTPLEPAPTGIDYLHLVEAQHTAELADRVRYAQLRDETVPDEPVPDGHVAGQLPLPGTSDDNDAPNGNSTEVTVAVGTALAGGPPHRSQRAGLPHWAPTLGEWRRSGPPGRDASRGGEVAIESGCGSSVPRSSGRAGCGVVTPCASVAPPGCGTR